MTAVTAVGMNDLVSGVEEGCTQASDALREFKKLCDAHSITAPVDLDRLLRDLEVCGYAILLYQRIAAELDAMEEEE